MEIQLAKPNKSTPYWRLHINNSTGFDVSNEPALKKLISIYFTKEQLKQFKGFIIKNL